MLLSCIICVGCSIMLVWYNLFFASATDSSSVEPIKIAATEQTLIPLLGIVISIWVALNIYNVISNKEIQLALRMSEKVKPVWIKRKQKSILSWRWASEIPRQKF